MKTLQQKLWGEVTGRKKEKNIKDGMEKKYMYNTIMCLPCFKLHFPVKAIK